MKSIKKIRVKFNRDLKRKFHKTNLLYTHSVQNEFKTKVEAYSILLIPLPPFPSHRPLEEAAD